MRVELKVADKDEKPEQSEKPKRESKKKRDDQPREERAKKPRREKEAKAEKPARKPKRRDGDDDNDQTPAGEWNGPKPGFLDVGFG